VENAETKIEGEKKEQGVAEDKEKAEKTISESGDSPSVLPLVHQR
jgi:hypothetical protein